MEAYSINFRQVSNPEHVDKKKILILSRTHQNIPCCDVINISKEKPEHAG